MCTVPHSATTYSYFFVLLLLLVFGISPVCLPFGSLLAPWIPYRAQDCVDQKVAAVAAARKLQDLLSDPTYAPQAQARRINFS